jgi:hypothetical protein
MRTEIKGIIEFIEQLPNNENERKDRLVKNCILLTPIKVRVEVPCFSILTPTRIIELKIKMINIAYVNNQLLIHLTSENFTTITLTRNEAIYLLKHKKLTKEDYDKVV